MIKHRMRMLMRKWNRKNHWIMEWFENDDIDREMTNEAWLTKDEAFKKLGWDSKNEIIGKETPPRNLGKHVKPMS